MGGRKEGIGHCRMGGWCHLVIASTLFYTEFTERVKRVEKYRMNGRKAVMTALCSGIAVAVTICLNEHTCPLIGSAEYGGSMCACFMEFKYQTGNVCRSALSLSLGLSGVSYHPRPGVGCFIAGSCRLRACQQFCDLPVRVLSCGAALGAGGIPCPPPPRCL